MSTPANSINEPTTGIVGMTGTGFTATAVTQYNVQVGGASTSTLASVAPSGTSGVPLISQGAASNPAFGTAVVAGGGTGATTAADARTNLGLAIGTNVQAWDQGLQDVAGLAVTDGNFIVGDGANWVAESGATARTSLGLGSIATQAASSVSITGGSITGITDLVVADGGTGVSSNTAYAVLCGGTTATGAIQSIASVGSSGQVLTSNGAGALPTFQAASAGGIGSNSTINIFDDCLSLTPATSVATPFLGYTVSGSGTAVTNTYLTGADSAHPGIYQLETGTTAAGYAFVYNDPIRLGGGSWDCEWLINIPDLSTGTQRFNLFIGLGNSSLGAEPTDGVYFHYRDDVNSGNWVGKTAAASSYSSANSANAVAPDVWIKLKVSINAGGTSASFYYNGTEIANSPLATNIPTTNPIYPQCIIQKTVGTTERTLWVDYMSLTGTLTSAR